MRKTQEVAANLTLARPAKPRANAATRSASSGSSASPEPSCTTSLAPHGARDTSREREDRTIAKALAILESRARQPGVLLTHSDVAGDWFRLRMAEYPVEVFAVAWLDARHRLIAFCELFRGTVDRVSVPMRELLRSAIAYNAVAALLAHNHPSGATEPSRDDIGLTADAAAALQLVGVRLLDHFVVGAGQATVSLAQRGCVPTALAPRLPLAARRGQLRDSAAATPCSISGAPVTAANGSSGSTSQQASMGGGDFSGSDRANRPSLASASSCERAHCA
ncbi:RadC-like JAB domain-containing protein [Tahibacter aquaticus]|uniref:RadC-like JAB domain-containing protein n=1 Tax=Tahibacter aquaticus TaxID=520092 RepID=A0A4V3DM01_9GAMM|nr:JAB domain-containing protein [Tahibacter aquaticus]TDR41959.1 RadC-like JAB domain-containing protein [Tahibacter aquaticus]